MSKRIQVVLDDDTYQILQLVAGNKDSEKARYCVAGYLNKNNFTKEYRRNKS